MRERRKYKNFYNSNYREIESTVTSKMRGAKKLRNLNKNKDGAAFQYQFHFIFHKITEN